MKKHTRNYLKAVLREYPFLDAKIKNRKESLLYPDVKGEDENIGGGQGNKVGNPVEAVGIKIMDDEDILVYVRHKEAIEISMGQLEVPMQAIIKKRYFENLKQNEVVEELGVTLAFIRISEQQCFRKLSRRLGLMK